MCSVCPKCAPPPLDSYRPTDDFSNAFFPILPVPVEPVELPDDYWQKLRRFEFPIGGLICSCPPNPPDE